MMDNPGQTQKHESLYKPSWYDQFTDWLDGLPGPLAMYYLFGAVIGVGAYIAMQASQGAYRESGFFGWHIFLALQPLIILGWMHYLDKVALVALERFRPAATADEETLNVIRYKITTLPARPALVSTVLGILLYLAIYGPSDPDQLSVFRLATTRSALITVASYFFAMWSLLGLGVYHTIHQIAIIRELFANYSDADPHHPEPLYAFSGITWRTAAFLLLISYGWTMLLLQTGFLESDPVTGLSVNIFFALFSMFIFVWPLWGAHQLLVEAKKTAVVKNVALMSAATAELHDKIERKEMGQINEWQTALGALEQERARIDKLPTWPWRPEALRGLIAALVVPITVWFLQYILERILG